jgi:hypothetical protein
MLLVEALTEALAIVGGLKTAEVEADDGDTSL